MSWAGSLDSATLPAVGTDPVRNRPLAACLVRARRCRLSKRYGFGQNDHHAVAVGDLNGGLDWLPG
jgi:hypothetical protein